MHIFGKVMLWFVMLGWLPALYFAVQMLHIQNSWSKGLADVKKASQDAEGIDKAIVAKGKERELHELKEEYARTLLGWGQTFPQVRIIQMAPNGELTLNVGENNGLRKEQTTAGEDVWPMVYGFQFDETTLESRYVGEFQVIANELREDQCRVRPTWRPFAQEIQSWNTATLWRFRTAIPGDAKLRYDAFKNSFTHFTVNIDNAQRNLAAEDEQLTKVTAQLQARVMKLLGPTGVPLGTDTSAIDPRFPNGLLPTIDEIEEERNDAQFELDRLRRLIKSAKDEVETLKSDVQLLYRQLPT